MSKKRISLCVLLYGDHLDLADRCLRSIWERLSEGRDYLYDIRIGLNEIAPPTRALVEWFVKNTLEYHQIPVITYDCPVNACKYPLIRKMVLEDTRSPAEFVMWFDDDSYLDGEKGWWGEVLSHAAAADMIGKKYFQGLRGSQWSWIVNQPWYNPAVGKPPTKRGRHSFVFATGGWWVVSTKVFVKHNWPCAELKHCGGDSMLGELLRHQGYVLREFETGVRINADKRGRHSKATPRGESLNRKLLGTSFTSGDKDTSHQVFDCVRTTYHCE